MRRLHGASVYIVSLFPAFCAFGLLLSVEPLPSGWLATTNPHFAANLLRAFALFLCGLVIGLITVVLLKSMRAEGTVSGGHPRKKLYRHVTLISVAHGVLISTLLFYIRERINFPLSPATPIVFLGLVLTIVALGLMLSYQNSRLQTFHAAKQILGIISPASPASKADFVITAVGSTEPTSLREWVEGFSGGTLARMTIEKVEEIPVTDEDKNRYLRWLRRGSE